MENNKIPCLQNKILKEYKIHFDKLDKSITTLLQLHAKGMISTPNCMH